MAPASQELQLRRAGVPRDHIYRDVGASASGSTGTQERRGWHRLNGRLAGRDTLVVVAIDRIGRRWPDTIRSICELRDLGVKIRSLAETGVGIIGINPPKRHIFVDSFPFEEPNHREKPKKSRTPRRATTGKPKAKQKTNRKKATPQATPQPRSLAGKPLAGFRATPDRRIIVLCGMIVSVIRFKNPLLHRQSSLKNDDLGRTGVSVRVSKPKPRWELHWAVMAKARQV